MKSQQDVGELKNGSNPIWKQVVSKLENQLFMIPWGYHILIIQKIKNLLRTSDFIENIRNIKIGIKIPIAEVFVSRLKAVAYISDFGAEAV